MGYLVLIWMHSREGGKPQFVAIEVLYPNTILDYSIIIVLVPIENDPPSFYGKSNNWVFFGKC